MMFLPKVQIHITVSSFGARSSYARSGGSRSFSSSFAKPPRKSSSYSRIKTRNSNSRRVNTLEREGCRPGRSHGASSNGLQDRKPPRTIYRSPKKGSSSSSASSSTSTLSPRRMQKSRLKHPKILKPDDETAEPDTKGEKMRGVLGKEQWTG